MTINISPDGTTTAIHPRKLKTFGRNPRKGNVGAIAASLKAHGQYRPIVVNIGTHTGKTNEVLAGNHTLMAFRDLSEKNPDDERWQEILVHWVDVDSDQAARIVLADNRTAELGTYNQKELASLLADVSDDLDGLGYGPDDLAVIMADHDDVIEDHAPEDEDLDEEPDDPDDDPNGGRGTPVLAYSIVFDDDRQRRTWMEFLGWLKRQYPDLTIPQRVVSYIEDRVYE